MKIFQIGYGLLIAKTIKVFKSAIRLVIVYTAKTVDITQKCEKKSGHEIWQRRPIGITYELWDRLFKERKKYQNTAEALKLTSPSCIEAVQDE